MIVFYEYEINTFNLLQLFSTSILDLLNMSCFISSTVFINSCCLLLMDPTPVIAAASKIRIHQNHENKSIIGCDCEFHK